MKFATLALALAAFVLGSQAGFAQIKPATSGSPSFNEPEPNPHASGEYRPNEPNEAMSPVDARRPSPEHVDRR